jgi:tRNA pseudouridine38-40 synthase
MHRYKLILAYDGTQYGGWQIQLNSKSIQGFVQEALSTALRAPTQVTSSSRTDAGVHALAQVAHFSVESPIDPFRLIASLNGILPQDIRVVSMEEVLFTFHARYSATGKIYHYHLHLDRVLNPFKRKYALHVLYPLDLVRLQEARRLFVGTHDFTSFANESHLGSAARNPVRTLKRLDLVQEEGGVRLEFEADGFLYKMVRNITGTLLEVGRGKLSPADVEDLFKAKDRKKAPAAAPSHGLFLVKVNY